MLNTPGDLQRSTESVMRRTAASRPDIVTGIPGGINSMSDLETNQQLIDQMKGTRMGGRRGNNTIKSMTKTSNQDIALAIPRFYDPMEYWDLSGLPWNMADEGHRHKLHKWMRLYYGTHRLVPTLIDIFTRFPLTGIEIENKDKKIVEFYEDVFLGGLDYESFLVSLGREVWLIGEAFSLGQFNESTGVWSSEELLNPEDIIIEDIPFLNSKQMKVVPPEYLKRLVQQKSPAKEYKIFEQQFPELIDYLKRDDAFPVDPSLLKQIAFKTADWDAHGTPILLRGLRTLMHEEKLLASQDAIAERLYAPLILAKLGIQDMGPNSMPWIPGAAEIESFRDDMDVALSSDFRLLVHHYGLDIENIFGREDMPDLGNDFDRIDRWIMNVFGISPSLISGGGGEEPYATAALNAEFMNQILRTYQKQLKDHFKDRALMVAEAQEHWDYEKRGQTRVPIMEEVVFTDPDTGKQYLEKRHKLLVPEMNFEVLDVRDEATERQFLQTLRAMGVPISDEKLMVGVSFSFKETLDEMQEEMIQKTVAQQMAKMQTFKILTGQGIPVPPELYQEITGMAAQGGAQGDPSGGGGAPPGAGGMPPPDAGGMGGITMPAPPPDLGSGGLGPGGQGGAVPGGGAPPATPMSGGPAGNVPDVSNERRPGLKYNTHVSRMIDAMLEETEVIETSAGIMVNMSKTAEDNLDEAIRKCSVIVTDIEIAKRDRKIAEPRSYVDEGELDWDMKADRPVVSKVTPRFRKRLAAQQAEEAAEESSDD